jgi:hypothetical protein
MISQLGAHRFNWKCEGHNLILPDRFSCPMCAVEQRKKLHDRGVAIEPRQLVQQAAKVAEAELKKEAEEGEQRVYTFSPHSDHISPAAPLHKYVEMLFQFIETHNYPALDLLRGDYEREISRRDTKRREMLITRMAQEVIRDAIELFEANHKHPDQCYWFDGSMRHQAIERLRQLYKAGQRVRLEKGTPTFDAQPRLTYDEERTRDAVYLYASTSCKTTYKAIVATEVDLSRNPTKCIAVCTAMFKGAACLAIDGFKSVTPREEWPSFDFGTFAIDAVATRFAEDYFNGVRRG